MEAALSVIIFAATLVVVASAPTLIEGQVPANSVIADHVKQLDYFREKRSQYPQYQYVSPCATAAAAASSPLPTIAPAAYQVNLSPYIPHHGYAAPAHNYYAAPHYRTAEFDPEMMSFSDMEQMMTEHSPMSRYAYGPAASHVSPAGYTAPLVPPATTGPAFGVFPNANVGGCSVPLLLSCSPSIVPGHLVQNQPHSYGDSYRGVEPLAHHDSHEHREIHEEPTVHDHVNPVHEQNHATVHQ